MDPRNKYVIIPIEMCFYALTNKFTRPFQVYIYLKISCSGKIKLDTQKLKEIASNLNLKSVRTIRNNLKKLVENNWIGYNRNSGYYFVRGFDVIREVKKLKRRTSVEFNTEDIKNIKAFCCGAIIGYLINLQKKKKWLLERERARSKHGNHFSSSFFPIATWVVAKILNVSTSTAHGFKQLAKNNNYISIKKNLKKTDFHVRSIKLFKKYFPEFSNRVTIKNNYLFLQEADLVSHNFYFKRRKKIESL